MAKTLYAKCSKCGEETFVRPEVLQKRIQKFGSEEEMNKKWECRSCSTSKKVEAEAREYEQKVPKEPAELEKTEYVQE